MICEEWTTVGREWEEIQDIIFCEITPGKESAAVAAAFRFPKSSNSSILLLAALEVQDLTEDKEGQRGENNEGGHKHTEQHCGFF